ncbi:MAG: acetyl-CoA carboxylase biotin carboxyl carrier protein [Polyangiaceae bacterium]|nr:acetyl-CoA carboxylase biotin carboxyl carrier protein [Polyangiaceae bacterium]
MALPTQELEGLLQLLREHGATEFEYEDEGYRLRIGFAGAPVTVAAASPAPAPAAAAATASPEPEEAANVVWIASPFVGTFYRAPSPDAAPFVEVGVNVRKGQVLCIVEAMKLMNEIESEHAGTLLEVLVENGQAVEYGQRLFKLAKS